MYVLSIFYTLNLCAFLGRAVPVLFIIIYYNIRTSQSMIQNQRFGTVGSNESQQPFEEQGQKSQLRNKIHEMWVIKVSEKLKVHVLTIIRFALCVFVGYSITSNIYSENFSQLSNGIAASNQILLDKSIRGVFPPLNGTVQQLYGKWKQRITTSNFQTTRNYQNYSIIFKENGDLELRNSNCKGDIKFEWHIFYYNLCLVEKEMIDQDQMQIPNQAEDIECIKNDKSFLYILTNSSIWSINSNILYIVSQTKKPNSFETNMLIFEKESL